MNQEPIGFMFVLHMMTSSRLILLVTDHKPIEPPVFSTSLATNQICVGRKDEGEGSVSGLYATHISYFHISFYNNIQECLEI